jgi:hypothetical protein
MLIYEGRRARCRPAAGDRKIAAGAGDAAENPSKSDLTGRRGAHRRTKQSFPWSIMSLAAVFQVSRDLRLHGDAEGTRALPVAF